MSALTIPPTRVLIPRRLAVARKIAANSTRPYLLRTVCVPPLTPGKLCRIQDPKAFATRRILEQVASVLHQVRNGYFVDIVDEKVIRPHVGYRMFYWLTHRFRRGEYTPLQELHDMLYKYLDYDARMTWTHRTAREFVVEINWLHPDLWSEVIAALQDAGYTATQPLPETDPSTLLINI